ncbi:hypothetical protein BDN72DRAFT_887332 [Pluteus cervinus]|uniref:Uncharacterized protein n=1 Tax=Pluteus cervinus TaxID=181527 RepID=A0ACD3B2B4_9AGAR|nr:hypothetical protein BDN72DRAFT_887332 [Pluteus cervinus]
MSSSPEFQWLPEYDTVLEEIGSTDVVNTEWDKLREMIKYKIEKNVEFFLANYPEAPPPPEPFSAINLASGGLKLAPFPQRKVILTSGMQPPVNYMTEEQAKDTQGYILSQLHEFESTLNTPSTRSPPFTIQRVCELCLNPDRHYRSVGKYLRAVEKALLVTSTASSFPPLPAESSQSITFPSRIPIPSDGGDRRSAPGTPLFSPIPFLHHDARTSRSPSPSPMTLPHPGPLEIPDPLEPKALGLVDELDDPSPGHLSDHPVALTAVTTGVSNPFLGGLEARFVKASTSDSSNTAPADSDGMVVDDDKENSSKA